MANESLQGVRYPLLSDSPDAEKAFRELLEDVVPRTNMRFATTAARDAAITSPVEGMECYTSSDKTTWRYVSGAWVVAHSDSGFVTLAAPSGATVRARRIGRIVEIKWEHSGTITPGSYVDIFTSESPIPTEWRPPHHTIPVTMHGTGARLMVGALTTAGRVYAFNKDTSNITNHQGYITFTVA